LLVIYHIT